MILQGAEILIGVTGGIAAFKTATLVSRLAADGARVSVMMTEAATKLVAPNLPFLSGEPVRLSSGTIPNRPIRISASAKRMYLLHCARHGRYSRESRKRHRRRSSFDDDSCL